MKTLILFATCIALAACSQEQIGRTLELTAERCRAYLEVNPEDSGKFARGCRLLLHIKSA